MLKTLRAVLAANVIVISLAACAIPDKFVGRATDYNRSVEEAENQGLLLNVVRASKGRPLYLTALAQVRGSMTASTQLQASAGAQLGQNFANQRGVSITPSFSIANGPSFDLAVLNSKEFANGFLAPLDLGVVQLLTRSDPDLRRALFLFIDEIAIELQEDRGTELFRLANDPAARPGEAVFFGCVVDFLTAAGLAISNVETERDVGVVLAPGDLGTAAEIAEALEKGIRFQAAGDRIALRRARSKFAFALAEAGFVEAGSGAPTAEGLRQSVQVSPPKTSADIPAPTAEERRIQIDFDDPANPRQLRLFLASGKQVLRKDIDLNAICGQLGKFSSLPAATKAREQRDGFLTAVVNAKKITLSFFPRSTAGVIQLVGRTLRFARDRADPKRESDLRAFDPLVPGEITDIFAVERLAAVPVGGGCVSPEYWVCVGYDGATWAIPEAHEVSARTLTVLQQLVTLNKSRADTPVTSAVTIVGAGAAGSGP